MSPSSNSKFKKWLAMEVPPLRRGSWSVRKVLHSHFNKRSPFELLTAKSRVLLLYESPLNRLTLPKGHITQIGLTCLLSPQITGTGFICYYPHWCARSDSNRQDSRRGILSAVCLPISSRAHKPRLRQLYHLIHKFRKLLIPSARVLNIKLRVPYNPDGAL